MTLPGAEPAEGPFTWQDFIHLDEDDLRELIDGGLLEVEVPKRIHEPAMQEKGDLDHQELWG